jgi:hypothetical protein
VPCGWTLVSVGVLRELARTQQKLSTSSAFESEVTFEVDDYFAADLLDLLRALEQRPALLIVRNNPAQVVGLLTSADLNRHAVRRMLFDRLSFVEEQLSKLVRRSFSADDDWLRFLPEDTQARVLGWHELSKRRNIHGSPVTHLTFPELVRIVKSARGVYRQLGFGSSSETDDYFGTCVAVRNRVMHATKPLVRSPEDVPQLRIALERCTAFETRVASGNFESGDSAR